MWMGRHFYGIIDRHPGHFFTATEFTHICFFPLLPHATFIILQNSIHVVDERCDAFTATWEGAAINRSWRSIRTAWCRALLTVLALGSACLGALSLLTFVGSQPAWDWIWWCRAGPHRATSRWRPSFDAGSELKPSIGCWSR